LVVAVVHPAVSAEHEGMAWEPRHSPSIPTFRVRGADLYCDLDLVPWEAVLGATVDIPTVDGTPSLKTPAGAMTERQLRLRGRGLSTSDGMRGNLYAVVSIQVLTHLTPEHKVLWEQWATHNRRSTRGNPHEHVHEVYTLW